MTFLSPVGLYLFAFASILILLSMLRSRIRRKPISALFLWTGLTEEPEPRAVRFQRWLDPLLFLQLAILAFLVLAIAQPMWKTERTVFQGIALVVDASASMNTQTDDGKTRYELAVDRAYDILDSSTSSRTTLIQFTSQPRILVTPTDDEQAVIQALEHSSATWLNDGEMTGLVDLVSAVGGMESYDRILLLSDHVPADLPPEIDLEVFTGGQNVAISAFTARENLTGSGVAVFLELLNETDAFLDAEVRIQDEHHSVTLSLPLAPHATDQYVVPFLASRGTQFVASLDVSDDFPADNTRYFALARPSSIRVRWIGQDNRYLRSGLESVLPVVYVASDEDYDLAVLVGVTVDELPSGNALLLGSQVTGAITLGEKQAGGFAETAASDHPLLSGLSPEDIYVETLPSTDILIPSTPLLTVNGHRFVTDAGGDERTLLILSTDLSATNLPITVDFPLLLRNMLAGLKRLPSPLVHQWRTIGELIEVKELGAFLAVLDPEKTAIQLDADQLAIPTSQPGFYSITTQQGVIPIAVNIDPHESLSLLGTVQNGGDATIPQSESKEILVRLWPYLALALLLLLIAESLLYVRSEMLGRRGA